MHSQVSIMERCQSVTFEAEYEVYQQWNNEEFAEYIQHIGDENEPYIMDDLIKLPPSMAMQWEGQHSIYNLIDQVFPSLQKHANDARYMVDMALLTPINDDVE